ncbi:two-component sensor histidine kinase [Azospira sp. I13]|uniref:ATP-binding protein n=1 Tax=Azospira sp. I13 TaxID=1765050 RepID=UPI000D44D4A0|nr:ATP-binding protein [Azospira sp. I13]GBG03859.1 two-component sensor histidine kinase [Azospira sp. I13]
MTGIDPRRLPEQEVELPVEDNSPGKERRESEQRFARLARARYSLSRLFFNFYLLAMGSFVGIALIADFAISTALQGITDDYAKRFMRGTIVLIEDELQRFPRQQWEKQIKALDEKFAYRLVLEDLDQILLPPKQREKLELGDIAIDSHRDIMFHRIRGGDKVLVVGPLSPDLNPEYQRAIPLELRIRLMTWTAIGLGFAVLVWLWIRPIWRDLESLRQTARALGEGRFEARAPAARSNLFSLLAETLNGMAERVQKLIAAQRELSSAISHELRTPIARLRFALEMAADTDDRSERERHWKTMEEDLEELDNLIDSSLTHARFERERPTLNLTPIALVPWLEEEVEDLRILAGTLVLEVDLAHLPPNLMARLDRKSMPYAVRNLLRNAFKYAKSRVRVTAEVKGDELLIHVEDDGIGVPEDERERIFDAFTRLDRSRDRTSGGYGLGLAIVRQVMEAHGGRAYADASSIGGARFTLAWPG